jgi:hypothetical protein
VTDAFRVRLVRSPREAKAGKKPAFVQFSVAFYACWAVVAAGRAMIFLNAAIHATPNVLLE